MTRMLLVILCASGCAVTGDDTTASDDVTHTELANERTIDVASGEEPEPNICELLPPCGPCSLACDHDALAETIPVGTCAVLLCTLTNGERIQVHACHRG